MATNALRSIISGDKRRYTADGYNLDLTYITPRLIAMGLPGQGVSTLWRNRVEEVASFLDKNHFGHYRIFSLGKSAADFFRLRNTTAWFGWSSKKAPPLELLNRILLAINDWLAQHPQNVAVIHCKEGRERSGVVIASYLVKSGVFATAKEALDFYASMRSKYQEGVQTPSQIRYVQYMCSVQQLPPARKIFLRKITMRPVPDYHSVTPIVEVLNSSVVPAQTLITLKDFKTFQKLDFTIPLEMSFPIQGDTYIQVFNRLNLLGLKANSLMFRVGFHTSFVPNRWVLTKTDLDGEFAGPVHDDKIRKGFTVEFLFTDGPFDALPVDPSMAVPQTQAQPQQYTQLSEMHPQYMQTANMPNASAASLYPAINQDADQYTQYRDASQFSESNFTPPTPSNTTMEQMNATPVMDWYNPSATTMTSSMPPPIDRTTKENRQMLNQASDAVARATERLMSMGTVQPKTDLNSMNQVPLQKTQL